MSSTALRYTRVMPQTISARRWKLDMGLNGKGKDGSRELAVQLFPQSADLLKCEGYSIYGRKICPCGELAVQALMQSDSFSASQLAWHRSHSSPRHPVLVRLTSFVPADCLRLCCVL